jgi:hypothetical protein
VTSGIGISGVVTSGGGCWDVGMEHRLGTDDEPVDATDDDFLTFKLQVMLIKQMYLLLMNKSPPPLSVAQYQVLTS